MVSIIIPNYNSEKYIPKCLDSILSQSYSDIEIIIVDDGSTDHSENVIQKYINKNKKITLIRQNNLNAAIARNEGLKKASGDYVLFLDSDDELAPESLGKMVQMAENNDADLVIGGFIEMDESGKKVGEYLNDTEKDMIKGEDIFSEAADFKPVPSDKLYSMKVIKKSNLYWGNVRIGQDLNFYYKYLLHCKKIGIIHEPVFKYRLTENSISRSYDFRIFDIVNSFNDVKKHYVNEGALNIYDKYLRGQELKHYNNQLSKQCNYKDKKSRKLIFDYFMAHVKAIKIDKPTDKEKALIRKLLIKRLAKPFYISNIYRKIKTKK